MPPPPPPIIVKRISPAIKFQHQGFCLLLYYGYVTEIHTDYAQQRDTINLLSLYSTIQGLLSPAWKVHFLYVQDLIFSQTSTSEKKMGQSDLHK